jgi:hypothetical protein
MPARTSLALFVVLLGLALPSSALGAHNITFSSSAGSSAGMTKSVGVSLDTWSASADDAVVNIPDLLNTLQVSNHSVDINTGATGTIQLGTVTLPASMPITQTAGTPQDVGIYAAGNITLGSAA